MNCLNSKNHYLSLTIGVLMIMSGLESLSAQALQDRYCENLDVPTEVISLAEQIKSSIQAGSIDDLSVRQKAPLDELICKHHEAIKGNRLELIESIRNSGSVGDDINEGRIIRGLLGERSGIDHFHQLSPKLVNIEITTRMLSASKMILEEDRNDNLVNEESLLEYALTKNTGLGPYSESHLEILSGLLNRKYDQDTIENARQGSKNHDGQAVAIMARSLLSHRGNTSEAIAPGLKALAEKENLELKDSSLFRALLFSDNLNQLEREKNAGPFDLSGTLSCSPFYLRKQYYGNGHPFRYVSKRRRHGLHALRLKVINGDVQPIFKIKNPFGNRSELGWLGQITLNIPKISKEDMNKINESRNDLPSPLYHTESFPIEELDCDSLSHFLGDYIKGGVDEIVQASRALNQKAYPYGKHSSGLGESSNPREETEKTDHYKQTPLTAPSSSAATDSSNTTGIN